MEMMDEEEMKSEGTKNDGGKGRRTLHTSGEGRRREERRKGAKPPTDTNNPK